MLEAETANQLNLDGIAHGFFGRIGGVSKQPFDSLNISFAVGDDPNAVNQNLDDIATYVGATPSNLCLVKQTHSTKVITVENASPRNDRIAADGTVTATKGLALGIQTADCGPVLFADPKKIKS